MCIWVCVYVCVCLRELLLLLSSHSSSSIRNLRLRAWRDVSQPRADLADLTAVTYTSYQVHYMYIGGRYIRHLLSHFLEDSRPKI